MADSELASRIQELELRSMEQQRLLDELSTVLFAQQRALDGVTQQMRRLGDKIAAAEPGSVDAQADDKPPHY